MKNVLLKIKLGVFVLLTTISVTYAQGIKFSNYPRSATASSPDLLLLNVWNGSGYSTMAISVTNFANSPALYSIITNLANNIRTTNDSSYLPIKVPGLSNYPGTWAGQPLISTQVGGTFAGPQLYHWSATQSKWVGGVQIPGGVLAYNEDISLGPDGNSGHLLVVSNNIDNVLSLQNLDNRHYAAWVAVDNTGQWRSAWGWGNSNATIYRNMNYIEVRGAVDNHENVYIVNQGSALFGVDTTGTISAYMGTTANPDGLTGLTQTFTINRAGNINIGTNIAGSSGRGNHGKISADELWLNGVGTTNSQVIVFGGLLASLNTVPFLNETNDGSLQLGIYPYGEYIHLITNGADRTTVINKLNVNNVTNTPLNTTTIRSWFEMTNNGTKFYVPMYQ